MKTKLTCLLDESKNSMMQLLIHVEKVLISTFSLGVSVFFRSKHGGIEKKRFWIPELAHRWPNSLILNKILHTDITFIDLIRFIDLSSFNTTIQQQSICFVFILKCPLDISTIKHEQQSVSK